LGKNKQTRHSERPKIKREGGAGKNKSFVKMTFLSFFPLAKEDEEKTLYLLLFIKIKLSHEYR